MNFTAFLITISICLISLIIAGKAAKPEDWEWFVNLNHPDNAFMVKIMNILGLIFFGLYGFALYQLMNTSNYVSEILVAIMILFMAVGPVIKYKTKNLKKIAFTFVLYPIVNTILVITLFNSNQLLFWLINAYGIWLIYDVSYYFRLIKLNPQAD